MGTINNVQEMAICVRTYSIFGGCHDKWVNLANWETFKQENADREYEIVDTDGLPFSERYFSISQIMEILALMKEMEDYEVEIFSHLLNESYTVEEALEKVQNGDYVLYSDCEDMEDVAYQVMEEGGTLDNVPIIVRQYFDFASFGEDLEINGNFIWIEAINGYAEIF